MNEGFVFDEKNHLYFYDGKPMTGCTTILGILAKPALIPWAAKMAVESASASIKSGQSYTEDELTAIFTEAKNAHRKKKEDAADSGTLLHQLVEEWVREQIALDRTS